MSSLSRLTAVRLQQEIKFGLDGNDAALLGEGWAEAEPGRRWSLGGGSELRMTYPGPGDLVLEIDAFPLIMTPAIPLQRIDVIINGMAAGMIELPDHERRALHIPAGRVPPGPFLDLRLVFPDAARPADYGHPNEQRTLAVCFSRLRLFTLPERPRQRRAGRDGLALDEFTAQTGVPADAALMRFESLGENRGLAMARTRARTTAPCVLASVGIGLAQLLRGLETGFAGLGDPGNIEPATQVGPGPYAVIDRAFAIALRKPAAEDRSSHHPAGWDPAQDGACFLRGPGGAGPAGGGGSLIEQRGARLRDLRRKLIDLATMGDRIFVVSDDGAGTCLTEQQVLPLLIALNRQSTNTLLWLTQADAANPPGTVEQVAPLLLRGWIGMSPDDAAFDAERYSTWLDLCANALSLIRCPTDTSQADFGPVGQDAAASTPAITVTATVPHLARPSMDVDYALLQSMMFGEDGNEEAALGFGWAGPEPGYRWTEGSGCELWLDHPGQRNVLVAVEAWPLVIPPNLLLQQAVLSAHDTVLGTLSFTEPARQAVYVPATLLRPGRILRLRFALPQAARPCDVGPSDDDRQIGLGFIRVAVHSVSGQAPARRDGSGGLARDQVQVRAGMSPEDLVALFEPLAGSPAFADIQAVFGVAPQGLLRRATIPLVELARAIDARFAGLGDVARLQALAYANDPKLVEIVDDKIKLSFLAEPGVSDTSPDLLLARQGRRLKFLRDQMLYDMSVAEKIFVYHRDPQQDQPSEAEMLALLIAIRQHGPGTLLFVTPSDPEHAPGTVEQTFPGLLHGYLTPADRPDRGAAENIWLEICANAQALVSLH